MTHRQLAMIETILAHNNNLSMDSALEFNQVIFGSICYQNWIDFNPKTETFFVTKDGKTQYNNLHTWEPFRHNSGSPLGKRAERLLHRNRNRSNHNRSTNTNIRSIRRTA